MSYTAARPYGPPVVGPAIGGKAAVLILRAACAVHRRYRIWKDRELLRSFPDHMLRDIGISRCEIDGIVEFGASDPTRRSAARRWPQLD